MFRFMTRRQFVYESATAAAMITVPRLASSRMLGSNAEIRVAVIGCGVRGGVHISEFGRQKGVRIVAVCDPDRTRSAAFAKTIAKSFGYKPDEVVDVRRLFDRKDLDIVSVATMQYWHSLPTIWACQTGRHVYVEKPLAHYIWEGRQMVNAARKFDRLVQIGTQGRSQRGYAAMAAWLKEGHLGPKQANAEGVCGRFFGDE
jgi:predicted dehydrogenase